MDEIDERARADASARPPAGFRRGVLLCVAGAILGAIVGGGIGYCRGHSKSPQSEGARMSGSRQAGRPAVPVTIATAETADFPVYLNGLGTAQPYNTVTVNSRVDGAITRIAFRQGQMVNEGDIVGSSRVDLQACKLEYSIVSPK